MSLTEQAEDEAERPGLDNSQTSPPGRSSGRRPSRRLQWIILPSLALVLVVLAVLLLPGTEGRRFSQAYSQLELGMSVDDVKVLFGAEPVFDCYYRSSWLLYFKPPEHPWFSVADQIDPAKYERGMEVDSLEELPAPYAHVALAFTEDGRLHAYTWHGETYTVETTQGSFTGSDFSQLSPEDFGG